MAIHVGDADIHQNQELLLCYSEGMSLYFESLCAQDHKDKALANKYSLRKKALENKAVDDEMVDSDEPAKKKAKRTRKVVDSDASES